MHFPPAISAVAFDWTLSRLKCVPSANDGLSPAGAFKRIFIVPLVCPKFESNERSVIVNSPEYFWGVSEIG
jgi:hypothetical protein